ncbi:MAG TPA: zinc-dependent metalloprotease family protein [Marmoricola sp.]|nr:zinc-dependent metalloprotease family protein [Marmoricola sp.]
MRLGLRSAAVLAGALALLGPGTQAMADNSPGPVPHARLLDRAGHGTAVVKALGDKLSAAAATNHLSTTRLASILESDHTAWLGQDGHMFYKEATAEAAAATQTATATATTTSLTASQVFSLHSLPSSTRKVFLDFDGAYVGGTYWNTSSLAMPSRFYTGFSLDSDPTTFNPDELAFIQQVWQIVAEKYAPFDVDITTEDPGDAGYNRSSSTDTTYGDHVLITDDAGAVQSACGGGCSGIALVGTFASVDPGTMEPAWVFSSQTWGSAVLTAHTVAHEVGHTFGLHHDGQNTSNGTQEYYAGQANWFPIMGSSINAVGQFSKGEYANATNTEDDLGIIARGAPLRADDYSDVMMLAQPLATGTLIDGVISSSSDRDVFAVNHDCTTNLTARATGVGAGASLDMSVTVLDANGNQVAYDDPTSGQSILTKPYTPTGMNASATVTSAPSGLYYVRIQGVGKGDPVTNGYSAYGSVGEYQLAVSTCDGTLPPSTMPTPNTGTATPTPPTVTAPSAPGVGKASSGRRGHKATAVARWSTPVSNGGAAIIGYRVLAERIGRGGRAIHVRASNVVGAGTHALTMRLPKGRYRFRIVAYNQAGASPYSAASRAVIAR